ncbi:hypothetical protein [Lacisediminihabitans profunda]|uniref:Alpha/beta hydrolase n=1 Tax=Lacisediminihabitans profunda TaxID=2594790 RepID=A0A5C8URP6_9MICO|nr:hypothetical protein [Lacisediminihabitans profunda]TXN30582.1 hypothetical protein FVP33_08650 [Lacisediminihabitans profunda]
MKLKARKIVSSDEVELATYEFSDPDAPTIVAVHGPFFDPNMLDEARYAGYQLGTRRMASRTDSPSMSRSFAPTRRWPRWPSATN